MDKWLHFTAKDITGFERFFRANLINSVGGYKPANCIGTYSAKGQANLALFSSVVHIGANPPLVGFIQRPVAEFSHTYKNIKENLFYTINHVHTNFIEKAHNTSAKFDENTSEFQACGLTEEKLAGFDAPFVKESRVKLGLRLVSELAIDVNKTILMIGQIEHIFMADNILQPDGNLDLNLVNSVCVSGLETYHEVHKIKSFPYSKIKNTTDFKNNESNT